MAPAASPNGGTITGDSNLLAVFVIGTIATAQINGTPARSKHG